MPLAPQTRARLHASLAAFVSALVWWLHHRPWTSAFALITLSLFALAWCAPALYAPIQRGLDHLARAFLIAFTWSALGLVYFGIFMPLRVWAVLTRRDPLRDRAAPASDSYLTVSPPAAPTRFERQF